MKDDKLPDKWCIKVTEENIDTLSDWRVSQRYPCGDRITKVHGYISNTGISERLDKYTGAWFLSVPLSHTEITFEQFKKYVLGMKDKKIVGYKLKDEFKDNIPVHKAAISIEGCNCFGSRSIHSRTAIPFGQGYDHERSLKKLTDAGVLDLWFEPVYEEERELPIIEGYKGEDLQDGKVAYGCKVIFVKTIRELLKIGVSNIEIDDYYVSRKELEQIVEYFDNK
jgi:hypothetical protein